MHMKKILPAMAILGFAGIAAETSAQPSGYASSVISYNSGSGFTAGFTNASSALGEPSRVTPGQFGGPVDPFSPPFLREQLVSIGAGGHLTIQLDTPALNHPGNPFGIDFMIFGNNGFVITNGDFSGGGITDGSLFGANSGETIVSVSTDGLAYYQLSPTLTPVVDGLFPTDGNGDFHKPMNPALNNNSFSGSNLEEIRDLYQGSGGGTPFDIARAQDSEGRLLFLDSIQFVRIDVLSGVAEIDGIAVAVPEPGTWALLATGFAGIALLHRRKRFTKA